MTIQFFLKGLPLLLTQMALYLLTLEPNLHGK